MCWKLSEAIDCQCLQIALNPIQSAMGTRLSNIVSRRFLGSHAQSEEFEGKAIITSSALAQEEEKEDEIKGLMVKGENPI